MGVTAWAWHVHHNALVEPLTEPTEKRAEYIRASKPAGEIPTRLHLLKTVVGQIPASILQAWRDYWQVSETYLQARQAAFYPTSQPDALAIITACVQAWDARDQAWEVYIQACATDPELLALHAQECPDCPWDGETIFPEVS